jgi:hypothetical protein
MALKLFSIRISIPSLSRPPFTPFASEASFRGRREAGGRQPRAMKWMLLTILSKEGWARTIKSKRARSMGSNALREASALLQYLAHVVFESERGDCYVSHAKHLSLLRPSPLQP